VTKHLLLELLEECKSNFCLDMQNVELKFGHVVSNAQLNVVCPPRRVARPLPGVKELIPERTLISPKGGGVE
jgi:hypothetical protein